MKSYKLMHQLIDLTAQFENENGDHEGSIHDFAGFLISKLQETDSKALSTEVRFGNSEAPAQEIAFQIDNNISRLVIFMSRYAKSYLKKALEGTALQSAEDFTALAILLTHEHLSKSELIARNIQEKTSGTEVIRRLIAAGLVTQWADEKDKRAKRISITNEGKTLLYQIFEHTSDVGKIITGKLTLSEKLTLQHLLQQLEYFHYPIHENKLIATKDDLRLIAAEL